MQNFDKQIIMHHQFIVQTVNSENKRDNNKEISVAKV